MAFLRLMPIYWPFMDQYWYFQNIWILFSASLSTILCILRLTFFSKPSKIRIYELKFSNCNNFNILLWFLIILSNDDAFATTADACSMVRWVCLFMKMHLLVLLQGNFLDLLCCAFLSKLSGCMRDLIAFCQHLLRLIYLPFWPIPIYQQNPNIGWLYWPGQYIGLFVVTYFMQLLQKDDVWPCTADVCANAVVML